MLRRLLFLFFVIMLTEGVYGEIVMRLSASNPSKTTAMQTEVKKLLPARIEKANVLDAGGLKVIYDADAKRYSVRKKVELQPEERRIFTIKLQDIWIFDEDELIAIKTKAEEIAQILEPTRGANEANMLRDRIAGNVKAILELQGKKGADTVSIPEHISAYDRNEVRFEAVQKDARDLEAVLSILGDQKILDEQDQAPVDVAMLWKVILIIISFVGIVTAVCFFVWTGQLRKIRQAERASGIDSTQ